MSMVLTYTWTRWFSLTNTFDVDGVANTKFLKRMIAYQKFSQVILTVIITGVWVSYELFSHLRRHYSNFSDPTTVGYSGV